REDPRFKTPALREQNVNDRLALTQEVLKGRTSKAWLERLEAEQVPCAPVLTRSEVITDPHVLAADILLQSQHPVAGHLRQTRAAARFSETATRLRRGAPRLGEHTGEVLRELGLSAAEIDALRSRGIIGAENADCGGSG